MNCQWLRPQAGGWALCEVPRRRRPGEPAAGYREVRGWRRAAGRRAEGAGGSAPVRGGLGLAALSSTEHFLDLSTLAGGGH